MKFPLQVQFRDIEESAFIYNKIWDHADKLEHFYDRIISCHVIMSAPHRRHHQGRIYRVSVRLHLPGGDIFISTDPEKNHAHEDAYVAIRDAFDAVRRKLEDFIRNQRGSYQSKKEGHLPSHGKVNRIFPNEGCGFISTLDHRELYFHENAVLNKEFGSLRIGDEVRFSEEMGERGPQVTSMSRVGQSGHLLAK